MDIRQIFINGDKIKSPKDIIDSKELNYKFISELESEAEVYYKDKIARNFNTIKNFKQGDQWRPGKVNGKDLSFSAVSGNPVWDMRDTFSSNEASSVKRPKRIVNLIKTKVDTLVANFAQVDPFPQAMAYDDYTNNPEFKTLQTKINLLLEQIFDKENNLDELYELCCQETIDYGFAYWYLYIDKDKSETQVPIKIKVVSAYINDTPKDCPEYIIYDPRADKLDTADYIIHKSQMRYWELKSLFDYKHTDVEKAEPEDKEIIDIKCYWFRTKNKDNKTLWFKFFIYNDNWLMPKDNEGKVNNKHVLEDMMYDMLPYEMVRINIRKEAHGDSVVIDLIDPQIQYNKLISMKDWHRAKSMDSPVGTNIEVDIYNTGNVPGGAIAMKQGEYITPLNQTVISSGEFEAFEQSIKKDMDEYVGNLDTLSGEKPTGTYSGTLLKTMQSAAQIKPKMWEKHFLTSIENLSKKALSLFGKYLGAGTITLFDPYKINEDDPTDKYQDITKNDIENSMYQIHIDTKDVNLVTRETRFQLLTQFMQYAKSDPIMAYLMALTAENGIPHLFPKEVLGYLKINYDNAVTQQPQQGAENAQPSMGGSQNNPPNVETAPADIPDEQVDQMFEQVKNDVSNIASPEQIQVMDDIYNKNKGTLSNRELYALIDEMGNKIKGA